MALYFDCRDCANSELRGFRRVCKVKHIDCSVRTGTKPCSHAEPVKKETEEEKTYLVTMSATAIVRVRAKSYDEASRKADWCDGEITDIDVVNIEGI